MFKFWVLLRILLDLHVGGEWSLKTLVSAVMYSNDLEGKFDKQKLIWTFSRPPKSNFRIFVAVQ